MRWSIVLALVLALTTAFADEKKADAKKSSKAKAAEKSDKNAAQKAEVSIGKWARENKVWGTPRPGDKK